MSSTPTEKTSSRANTRDFKIGDVVKHALGHKALLLDMYPDTDRFGNPITMLKVLYEHPKNKTTAIRYWEWSNFYVWIPVD